MSLCVMFSRFEPSSQQQQQQQQYHHRDGRNNKADRSRHLWQPWVDRATDNFDADHSRALSLRCSAMEGTVGTVGKWKRERRHRAVWTSPASPSQHFRSSQEPLDMTTAAAAASRALPKERASVIMALPATGHRPSSAATGGMSDPVIDEHFRRSLGKDYMNVFAPAVARREQQREQQTTAEQTDGDNAGLSAVDDHFAKALGDTWVKLQKEEYQKKRKETTTTTADGGRQKVNVYAV